MTETSLLSLPEDVHSLLLSMLATPDGLSRISKVSKSLNQKVQNNSYLWQEIAERKYGRELARSTASLYNGDWKEMLRDDNRRGARLAVTRIAVPSEMWRSTWRFCTDNRHYCCLIVGVSYDRFKKLLCLYLDVRGNFDLRHPRSSHLLWKDAGSPERKFAFSRRMNDYVTYLDPFEPGHFKCAVQVGVETNIGYDDIHGPGAWVFAFANDPHTRRFCDYDPVVVLDLDHGQSLESKLRTMEGFHYAPRDGCGVKVLSLL